MNMSSSRKRRRHDQQSDDQQSDDQSEDVPIHVDKVCAACGVSPIAGGCYQCVPCTVMTRQPCYVCESCHGSGAHGDGTAGVTKLFANHWFCDVVGSSCLRPESGTYPLGQQRWQCTTDPDFDSCRECRNKTERSLKLATPEDTERRHDELNRERMLSFRIEMKKVHKAYVERQEVESYHGTYQGGKPLPALLSLPTPGSERQAWLGALSSLVSTMVTRVNGGSFDDVPTWDRQECIEAVSGCLLAGATADEVRTLIVRCNREFGGGFVSMVMAELDQAPTPLSLDHRVCHGHYTSDRQFVACDTKLSGQPRSVTDCRTIRAAKSARAGSARRCLGAKGLSCSMTIPSHDPAWKVRCIRCWNAARGR